MTIDQRIEKLEFVVAGHIEQAKLDYEENRRLWREMKEDQAERDRQWEERGRELREEVIERDRLADARGKDLDKRITELVVAIGALIQKIPVQGGAQ